MQNLTRLARRRRAFLRINIALSICALGFTSLTMASKAKEALAFGPQDGVCANIIGTANCPQGSDDKGFINYQWTTCHQSSAWYYPGLNGQDYGPYYNCCLYNGRIKRCVFPDEREIYPQVQYLQSNSNGEASCAQGMAGPDWHCVYPV